MSDGRYVRLVWTIHDLTREEARELLPILEAQVKELVTGFERTAAPARRAGQTKAKAEADIFVCDAFAELVGSTPVGPPPATPKAGGGTGGSGG